MTSAGAARRLLVWLLSFIGVVLLAGAAAAHDPFEITTVGRVRPDELELVVTMTRATGLELVTGISSTRETLGAGQFAKLEPAFEKAAAELFEVTSNGRALRSKTVQVALSEDNELEFRLTFPPPEPGPLRLRATHLTRLEQGYGNAVVLKLEQPDRVLGVKFLNASNPVLDAVLPEEASKPRSDQTPGETSPSETSPGVFRSFLYLGVEHILIGYDHLLFLAGLLLGCRSWRSMVVLVSCFTLAHSLTLALATLDWVLVPERAVESLIAASIVVVGVQNFLAPREPKRRYLLAFGFGLIHGLGFAGALRDLGLGGEGSSIVIPLLSFNLGVELGQIAVAGLALPLLLKLRGLPHGPLGFRWGSLLIASLGAYWFLERSLG